MKKYLNVLSVIFFGFCTGWTAGSLKACLDQQNYTSKKSSETERELEEIILKANEMADKYEQLNRH